MSKSPFSSDKGYWKNVFRNGNSINVERIQELRVGDIYVDGDTGQKMEVTKVDLNMPGQPSMGWTFTSELALS